jgi:LPS sulfotransferase NodH
MRPTLCYTIWFSQRTGSTLLCSALESTGIAGRPGEHLEGALPELYARYRVASPAELLSHVWTIGGTPNGVVGLKYGLVRHSFDALLEALRQIDGHNGTRAGIWANAFPNGRHIFMTRRNKVRLAVSWWKAIQSREWHRAHGVRRKDVDIADRYDPKAIDHLVSESVVREAAMQDVFSEAGIVPFTVVYEDFVAAYERTVADMLVWLGLGPAPTPIAPPAFQRLSDELSEEWVERFRGDKQKGWGKVTW